MPSKKWSADHRSERVFRINCETAKRIPHWEVVQVDAENLLLLSPADAERWASSATQAQRDKLIDELEQRYR